MASSSSRIFNWRREGGEGGARVIQGGISMGNLDWEELNGIYISKSLRKRSVLETRLSLAECWKVNWWNLVRLLFGIWALLYKLHTFHPTLLRLLRNIDIHLDFVFVGMGKYVKTNLPTFSMDPNLYRYTFIFTFLKNFFNSIQKNDGGIFKVWIKR